MNLRVGHISDFHLTEGARFSRACSALVDAARIFADESVELILVTGDLAGKDSPHRYTLAERIALVQVMSNFADIAPTVVIRGNHDSPGEIPLFRYLNRKHKIYTADRNLVSYELDIDGKLVNVYCHPWIPVRSLDQDLRTKTQEEAQESALNDVLKPFLGQVDNSAINILASHSPCVGASVGGFIIPSVRDLYYTPEFLNESGMDYIGIGHIHERQQIAEKAWYVGTPYPTDYSESGERGVSIVDINVSGDNRTTDVRFVKIDSFKLNNINIEWDAQSDWTYDPLEEFTDIDGNYFRFNIQIPFGIPHTKVPAFSMLFTPLAKLGGEVEIRIKNLPPVAGAATSSNKPLIERIKQRVEKLIPNQPEAQVDCLELYEDIIGA